MARNQEKAQAMLNRFLEMKRHVASGKGPGSDRRPGNAASVKSVREAQRWRAEILKEISHNVSIIQDASLGEHRIRDLNDQINRLMRQKHQWEKQIRALGGGSYFSGGPKVYDSDGKAAFGTDGYYYFGAARDLPGVRELFEQSKGKKKRKDRSQLLRIADADYYGYRDDDDGHLERIEAQAEKKRKTKAIKAWEDKQESLSAEEKKQSQPQAATNVDAAGNVRKAHVPIPSPEEIQQAILEKRKKAILAKYNS